MPDEPKKTRSDKQRRAMFRSIKIRKEAILDRFAEEDDFEDDEEDWIDEDGNCMNCDKPEEDCTCAEDEQGRRDLEGFVPEDD
jgi:hypothetical protein